MLAALSLAVGVVLGGFCALLAWRRPPVPPADAPHEAAAAAPLSVPRRLPASPDHIALAANDHRDAASVAVTVLVRNVDAKWRTEAAGVAIVPSDGSSGLAWLPLATATASEAGLSLQHTLQRGGEVVVALASARTFALHAYLTRSVVTVTAPTTIELDATATRVGFQAAAGSERTGPFRLVRTDDARWVAMDVAAAGLVIGRGTQTQVWLGRGTYELCDPLQPERRQQFAVPATTVVEISAQLAALRAGPQ